MTPLDTGTSWQVNGPSGSYVFDAVWHRTAGLFLAFGCTHGRGSWAVLRVLHDRSVEAVGVPEGAAVMSLCFAEDGELLLGVASVEEAGGRQVGGGIASFSVTTGTFRWLYRARSGEHF